MPSSIKCLLNLALPAVTLVSKFALIFVLAKFLEPAEMGLYDLLSTTVFYVWLAPTQHTLDFIFAFYAIGILATACMFGTSRLQGLDRASMKRAIDRLEHRSYTHHFSLLYWAVLAAVLSRISMTPHYGLYARRKDRPIIFSHLASLQIFFLAGFAFVPLLAMAAVPAAMALAFLFLLLTKFVTFKRCGPLIAPL
ncbi:hypothetical protein [Thauera linaloolentis]|uniref:O antigen flippase n=1 Tax=Thauera linaloolentis (strain DSM 12138 / JCM 21573 / CCUG 41526 / CIP 105981 / IAM 15112 / NBRC 102519 / 47Lol) TaxID=1123367 RepID=N6YEI6_THAL4|nr:hypothetical protein [Thauera linaloolentis]ENO89910.1 O antigen flippase [Thauera linaloolentis 47Lol = DSM 12138]MCM8564540.1 hypothetical protein [Thauera linaloolentis]